ncbi:tRNA (N(6)-L-threonylcarbamoyladenosine(37)-C(2))-methylthiotransferase MtaB [Butyrivibrio sp. INlla16]|uniref:tRNA (N(6)-L-threonylcarbamoyladenosine(37)-C(2))- methylthiotransferase MtaB n=1 Tax=Butyrivibrio sp. INlla16 TaxID=1520807 RepID=UPI0008808F80|nr:tRNA (N(6)-L-threonylcarbamoyladenosine(37)-C(2))-methylthiotransferase MtaB [Butyrivibrio sp. INlla16]SDB35725.1 threonylcarbamoyladenosine tRNA methylthiotransferase MtaB [Butyrivibrio sp. INlla16]
MKSVALHSLGCKVNRYETDVMGQKLQESGYNIVAFDEKADVYIINTCSVTSIADHKSRQMLHRAKRKNPEAVVVACGCYVETDKEGVKADDSIDLIVGNNKKTEIVEILRDYFEKKEEQTGLKVDKLLGGESMTEINDPAQEYERMELKNMPGHTRAYIKIQDGCNQFCSYCIIPYARGRIRSRDEAEILCEVRKLAADGCREIVLTGIHISSYGLDKGESALLSLLQKLNDIEGIDRIRLSSLEPRIITEEMAEGMAALPKVCPHFHLSLQSGSNDTLKRMNRHYSAEEYAESVRLLRKVYDKPAITTDIIVGFPGETEETFEESRQFAEDIDFYEMHVFKYSPRKGTVAAKMEDQLTDREKTARSNVLLTMTKEQSKRYRESFIGATEKVLWEDFETIDGNEYLIGLTTRYIRIAAPKDKADELGIKSGDITEHTFNSFLRDDTLLI